MSSRCFIYLFWGSVTLSTYTHRHYHESVHRKKHYTRGNNTLPYIARLVTFESLKWKYSFATNSTLFMKLGSLLYLRRRHRSMKTLRALLSTKTISSTERIVRESGAKWPTRVIWPLLEYQPYGAAIFLTSIGTSTSALAQAVTLWRQWM